jgi:hypothetical protein
MQLHEIEKPLIPSQECLSHPATCPETRTLHTAFYELLLLFVRNRFAAKAMSYSDNGLSLIILGCRRLVTKCS